MPVTASAAGSAGSMGGRHPAAPHPDAVGGGPTTTGNVVSLCAECHLVGVHGGRLKLSGDADERGRYGRLCGLRVEQVTTGDVWQA